VKTSLLLTLALLSVGLTKGWNEVILLEENTLVEATPEQPKVLMEESDLRQLSQLVEEGDLMKDAYDSKKEEVEHWKKVAVRFQEELAEEEAETRRLHYVIAGLALLEAATLTITTVLLLLTR
jgi:hypothetical protein